MFYQGNETITFFKDNEEDMAQYKNMNLEEMKKQGWSIQESDTLYVLSRRMRMKYQFPVIDAEFVEKRIEDAKQG